MRTATLFPHCRQHIVLLLLVLLLPAVARAQAPALVSTTPARNAIAAPTTSPVRLTLSQPVGAGANAVRVFSAQRGGRLAGTVTTAGSTLTFAPAQPFQPGEVVSVTVPATVQSSAGTPLAAPQVYQFTAAATGGSGVFGAGPTVAVGGTFPERVVVADVDNDGDQDLVVSTFSTSLAVRLNNGSGGFTPGSSVNVGNYTDQLQAADVDGDGDLDLLSSDGFNLAVRLNNGSGQFSSGSNLVITTSTSNLVTNLLTGDIDGDGDLDIVVKAPTISTLLNDGSGTFSAGAPVGSGGGLALLALGDVDNDGDLDLISEPFAAASSPTLGLRLNNGNGTFVAAAPIVVSASHTSAMLADIDNDGDLDLVAAGYNNTDIRLNNGHGLFSGTGLVATGAGNQDVNLADLDGDGDLDMFVASYNTGAVSIHFNNGTGSFTGATSYFIANSLYDATAADLDGDGDLDIAAVAASTSNARILLNQSSNAFTVTSLAPTRNLRNAPRASNVVTGFSQPINNTPASAAAVKVFSRQRGGMLAGTATVAGSTITFDPTTDFRPGERVEVSVTREARSGAFLPDKPEVYQFTAAVDGGTGTFAPASVLSTFGYFPIAALAADMNGDGHLDVLTLDQNGVSSSGVSIQSNTGTGTFVPGGGASGGVAVSGMAVADVDGDGDLDVLTSYGDGTSFNPGTVGIRYNNGTGSFPTGTSVQVGQFASGLTTGDVDGDGDVDIVAINGGALAGVCLNAGNGTFGAPTNVVLSSAVYNLVLADIDGDGDLDLLAALGSRVGVHLNNGLGVFGAATVVSVPSAKALTTADVDGDGDLDLLACDGFNISVRLNNGSGVFGGGSSTPVACGNDGTRFSIAAGDIDGDGDLDVVAGGGSLAGVMSVRLNNGSGVFGGGYDPVVAPDLTMPTATALADLDGDGDLDWLVARYNGGGVRVLFNQVAPIISSVAPASGIIGNTVTITGSNFTGATALTLNGMAITGFTVAAGTTITFTLPPGASSGPLVITTPTGTATSVSYPVLPVPAITSFTPTSGNVGMAVALTGTNFTGATAVTVGGAAAVFTVVSATRITLTVPAAAITGPITVTAPGGTGTSGTAFTVTVPPTITSFTPVSAASGTSVTLTGTNLTGATAVTLAGILISGFTVVNATTLTFVLPAGAISGQLAVTTPGGTATSAGTLTVVVTPAISLLIPAAQVAGSAAFSLMLVGAGFTPASTVSFNGVMYPQTSSTYNTLTVNIPAAELTTAANRPVTVTNLAGVSNTFTFIVSRPSTAGSYEDFEANTKFSYPAGNVALRSGSWNFTEAMIGTTVDDKFNGLNAARLQAGFIAMNFDKPDGAGTVVVHAALYGTDTGATFRLEKSTDGGVSYAVVPGAPATLTSVLTPYSFTINQPGNVRLRISSTNTSVGTGPRIMLDDLSISDYVATAARAGLAGAGLVVYPNPAHRVLTVQHPGSVLTGVRVELLDLSGRVVREGLLPATGQLDVSGLAAGSYVLRVAGFIQRVHLQ